jgi:proline iminopeptidase
MPTLANDVEGLRRHLGVEQMVVMGHSFGATVAVESTRAHPDRVAKLVLIGAAVDVPEAMASWVESLRQANPDSHAATLAEPAGVQLQALGTDDACARSRASMAFVDTSLATVPDRQAFRDLRQFRNRDALLEQQRLDAESVLRNTGEIGATAFGPDASFPCYWVPEPGSLAMPVLLVVGRHDQAVGVRAQRVLAGRLPDATLVALADSAHFAYAEEPEAFDAAVHSFHGEDGAAR